MFGFRVDGKKVKCDDVMIKLMPHIMENRCDSQNYIAHKVRAEKIDEWIKQQAENGVTYSYLHVMIAISVRLFAMRPKLNRFVVNGVLYQRKHIAISLTIKKELTDDAVETAVKFIFNGEETIYEIKDIVDREIRKAINAESGNQKLVNFFGKFPHFVIRPFAKIIKFFDKHGMLGEGFINSSVFHSSMYMTYLKSIKCDAINHHLFNFGTTGMFMSVGNCEIQPVCVKGELTQGKVLNLGVSVDERFCDGFYWTQSLRIINHFAKDLSVLEQSFVLKDAVIIEEIIKKKGKVLYSSKEIQSQKEQVMNERLKAKRIAKEKADKIKEANRVEMLKVKRQKAYEKNQREIEKKKARILIAKTTNKGVNGFNYQNIPANEQEDIKILDNVMIQNDSNSLSNNEVINNNIELNQSVNQNITENIVDEVTTVEDSKNVIFTKEDKKVKNSKKTSIVFDQNNNVTIVKEEGVEE